MMRYPEKYKECRATYIEHPKKIIDQGVASALMSPWSIFMVLIRSTG